MFYGAFQKDKLLALLRLNKAYAESDYNGQKLYYWVDDKSKKNQVGAFATDGLIIIGQKESCVIPALDVLAGRIEPLSQNIDAKLYSLCNVPPSTFVLAAAQGVSDLMQDEKHAAILKNSQLLAVLGSETDGKMNLNIHLETQDQVAAIQVEQVVAGMMAFTALSQKGNPDITALIKAVTVIREANTLDFNFNYPSVKLLEILRSCKKKDIAPELDAAASGDSQ
jgi:hypothetical protein